MNISNQTVHFVWLNPNACAIIEPMLNLRCMFKWALTYLGLWANFILKHHWQSTASHPFRIQRNNAAKSKLTFLTNSQVLRSSQKSQYILLFQTGGFNEYKLVWTFLRYWTVIAKSKIWKPIIAVKSWKLKEIKKWYEKGKYVARWGAFGLLWA